MVDLRGKACYTNMALVPILVATSTLILCYLYLIFIKFIVLSVPWTEYVYGRWWIDKKAVS